MKILVFAHHLVVGGTPVNGIDLAAGLRDWHGHDVVVFATPGPMLDHLRAKRLRFIAAPAARIHPSPARMRALRQVVRAEKPDLLHVWDWFQCLEAYYSVHLPMRIPMVVTDMCMTLTRVLPKKLPTTFGTPELVAQARASGRHHAEALLPPIDVHLNAPTAVDSQPFKDRYQIRDDNVTLVTVSRLDPWMKGDSLRRTIAAVKQIGAVLPLRLVIVGDGPARAELERQASEVNTSLGRNAVTLAGEWIDPRPAYAAADIVVGMGGSALRGMAFAKPVLIVGAKGYCAPFNLETAEMFLYRGMYGEGTGSPSNACMVDELQRLLSQQHAFGQIGQFAREFVVDHFSLQSMSATLSAMCLSAAQATPHLGESLMDSIRTAAVYFRERRFLHRPPPLGSPYRAEFMIGNHGATR
jgi:L-malate glycosyltransferase